LSSLCAPGNTSRSVTHPEIAPGQARLTPEFFAGGLPEKKLQLGGISMLLILLSRGDVTENEMTLFIKKFDKFIKRRRPYKGERKEKSRSRSMCYNYDKNWYFIA
jgi:hypothetical protein